MSTILVIFAPRVWMTDVMELGYMTELKGDFFSFPIDRRWMNLI